MTAATREGLENAPALAAFAEQGAVFDGLKRDLKRGEGVHAYLFCGPKGVGKRTLAALTGQGFLCKGTDRPCGQCPECIRVLSGSHPDVTILQSEKSIGVDAIRELLHAVSEHTYEGGKRIVRIENAERMTPQAQNSLLKTLEEPNEETVFLLTCDDATKLLPTIISRCRMLRLHPWSDAYIIDVLQKRGIEPSRAQRSARVSGGSIGAAIACAEDESYWQRRQQILSTVFALKEKSEIGKVSNSFKDSKDDADGCLTCIEEMLREVLMVRLHQAGSEILADFPVHWKDAAVSAPLDSFDRLLDAVFHVRRLKASQVNWQAALETLLLAITEEIKQWQL